MVFLYIVIALVGAAGAVFALQNFDPVEIQFLGWKISGLPLAMVILLSFVAGMVLASLVGLGQQWRLRSRIRHLEARLTQAGVGLESPH